MPQPKIAWQENAAYVPPVPQVGLVVPQPGGLPLLGGNAAAARAANARPVLLTHKEFRRRTDPGTFSVRSHRLVALEKLLKRHEVLMAEHQAHGDAEARHQESLALADELQHGCAQWLAEHEADPWGPRHAAVAALRDGARDEAVWARKRMTRLYGAANVPQADVAKLTERFRSQDAHSAFERVRGVIDHAVPNPGSKAELEVEIDIPIYEFGFVGLRIKAEADRSEDAKLKVRAEAAITGGARFASNRLKLELGTYLEVVGKDATEVCRLLSYGLMRIARESPIFRHEITNYLWGKDTGQAGFEAAERFGAAVEREAFAKNKDAYVEAGAFGGFAAEGGAQGLGKFKASVQVGGGTRWDAASIKAISEQKDAWPPAKRALLARLIAQEQRSDDAAIDVIVAEMAAAKQPVSFAKTKKIARAVKAGEDWSDDAVQAVITALAPQAGRSALGVASADRSAAEKSRGEHVTNLKAGAEVDFGGLGTAGLKFELHWMSKGRARVAATHFREAKVEGKAGLKVPMHKQAQLPEMIALGVGKSFTKITEMVQAVRRHEEKRGKIEREALATSGASSAMEDIALLSVQSAVPLEAIKKEFAATDPFKAGFSAATTYLLTIDCKWKAKAKPEDPRPYELNITLAEEKALKGEIPGGYGRVSAKASQRFFRMQKKHDKTWQVEFFGAVKGGDALPPKPPAAVVGAGA